MHITKDELRDKFKQILAAVPEADKNKIPVDAIPLGDLDGQEVIVTGIKRAASHFAGDLKWYLVIDMVRPNGEKIIGTSGAKAVVGQLAIARHEGWLPLKAIPRVAKQPTKQGYYPLHLEIVR